MSMMESVIRITDRFYDPRDPDALDRESRLQKCVLIVAIAYVILLIGFYRLKQWEIAHPRIIHDVDVSFEFTPPPPEPPLTLNEAGKGPGLSAGGLPGGSAPAPAESAKVAMPMPQAPTISKPMPVPAKPVPSHKATIAAPIAVVPQNNIKTPIKAPPPPTRTAVSPPTPPQPGAAAVVPPAGGPVAAGAPGGTEGGAGAGGQGLGGAGTGTGVGNGPGGGGAPQISMALGTGRAMGNIAPYRKDLLVRLAKNWHPKNANENIIVLITLSKDGKLINDPEIFQSSGNKKSDKAALAAVASTDFAPLPDWYKGEHLTFKIELSKVEALQQ